MSQPDTTAAPVPPVAQPQKEHQWLRRFLGEWTYKTNVPATAGQPAHEATGSETFGPLAICGSSARPVAKCPEQVRRRRS
jgi:hypothetical protein